MFQRTLRFNAGDIITLKPASEFPRYSRNSDKNLRDSESIYLVESVWSDEHQFPLYKVLDLYSGSTMSFSSGYIDADYRLLA